MLRNKKGEVSVTDFLPDIERVFGVLKGGRGAAVEQWISCNESGGFRFIRWVRIAAEAGQVWAVYDKVVLDSGAPDFFDIDEFQEVRDPDEPEGQRFEFGSPEAGVAFAIDKLGADPHEFVSRGGLQGIYLDFLTLMGPPKKGLTDWLLPQ